MNMLSEYTPYLFLLLLSLGCEIPTDRDPGSTDDPAGTQYYDDTIAVADLPWPPVGADLPECSSAAVPEFALPPLSEPAGEILITPSAYLQPVGIQEKMELRVKSGASFADYQLQSGALTVHITGGGIVIDSGTRVDSVVEIRIRCENTGNHRITVSLVTSSDTLQGTCEIVAYVPRLPVVEMDVNESNLRYIQAHPYDNIKIPAQLTWDGTLYSGEVRLHGGSSRDYPKKSFRFDIGNGRELPDSHDHLIFRAEWNDKTILRNYLCLELAHHGLWLPVPKAEMVHFRINRQYYGVMWRVERIGGDFLSNRGLSTEGSLYEADPESECFTPGGNLTPLASLEEYQCVYALQKGTLEYTDLVSLIEETLVLPDGKFEAAINSVVRVNDMLSYFAFMAVIQNHDHTKKNYYLYRDPKAADTRWTIFTWDMELTLGHLWTEENDVLDEQIFTDGSIAFGATLPPVNALFSRLYAVPVYRERFEEMAAHFLTTVFTEEFVDTRIKNVLCRATPDILADNRKRATNKEYLERVDELMRFMKGRRQFIESLRADRVVVATLWE